MGLPVSGGPAFYRGESAAGAGSVPRGLIERDEDRARMRQAIRDALAGEGSLVFVQGPAGIGKTHLIAACAEDARASEMTVLTARCSELESDFTHGVAR